ncbi:S-formylglutathione hydrolase [Idiomarina loihiensis]|uniref:S-formylglutathione hydrolase n=1 Tax=Idiomarina loihiensis (strain ATCC BAA-735 / DSM 15497 / L2-TR) TaxID=283942 RepID=Q5QXA5_IDILO|nr:MULTISPECIES: S-formylglutathione hydrolase [Idiomarina]PHQ91313.1 MAG: S-formylglutathione hydrolase [Idiomarina sp.]AAV82606.1 Predicted esterase [Idiomarina loihiensis L2TR]AGM36647.1 esterase [Idiomarina loihiensis GSL 199]MRJ45403.1 S-formylglutathione hydrolase [Idiomarina loihiensis]TDO49477.1 S-formylglutathione hydrolase [Idiomarina sp. 017G]
MKQVSETRCFGGRQLRFEHDSEVLNCAMQFSVFLPLRAEKSKVPAVYFLSGLTCTDENFSTKAGAQRVATELGIALIVPDTSPRGDNVADDPDGAYDLGLGAGFYVNATQEPWKNHYQMYDYIVKELPKLVEAELPINDKRAIAGHSMGGHGALVIGLRNSDRYSSISAFSPITNPTQCPWGEKAFSAYLGDDREQWKQYDAVEIIKSKGQTLPIRVDQGLADGFLEEQLKPENLKEAIAEVEGGGTVHLHDGYDHSYYFISSFIEAQLRFHAKYLNA